MIIRKYEIEKDRRLLEKIVLLHKKSLEKTIATTISNDNLEKLYCLLLKNGLLSLFVALDENKVVGCMSIKEKYNLTKISLIDIFLIAIILLTGFLLHPLIWVIEITYKLRLYRNFNPDITIIAIFVDSAYQGQNIGKDLLASIIKKPVSKIGVDTRINNTSAINFYKKNGFIQLNKNKRNISLSLNN